MVKIGKKPPEVFIKGELIFACRDKLDGNLCFDAGSIVLFPKTDYFCFSKL